MVDIYDVFDSGGDNGLIMQGNTAFIGRLGRMSAYNRGLFQFILN